MPNVGRKSVSVAALVLDGAHRGVAAVGRGTCLRLIGRGATRRDGFDTLRHLKVQFFFFFFFYWQAMSQT